MNTAQAKQIHLKDLLQRIGHEPVQEDKGEYWYLSPFREETKASFKITRDGKGWYDHGAGEGGNILDFVMRYPGHPFQGATDIAGALRALRGVYGQAGPTGESKQGTLWKDSAPCAAGKPGPARALSEPKPEPAMLMTNIQPLQNPALIAYLQGRKIDFDTAGRYLQEAYYSLHGKSYFALAFANQSGGYELRNPYFQGSYAVKDISLISAGGGGSASVALFEGFMDFLSALAYTHQQTPTLPVIVLNSASMRHRALSVLQTQKVREVHLYFDHDATGRTLTDWFQQQLPACAVTDQSSLYTGYKDFNEWLKANGTR